MAERPLTVLQVLPALDGGGVERGTLEVARALVKAGHRSLVLSAGGRMVAELTAAGSRHVALPVGRKSPLTLRLVPRVRRLLREEQVDVLHLRSRLPAWVAYLAWRGLPPGKRPRLVTTVHGFYSVSRYSAIMTRGERVIAVSDAIRRYVAENYPAVDPRRVEVIHRGVDPAAFPHGYRPPAAWADRWQADYPGLTGKRVLTLPGRLTRLKGHLDFVDLVGRLRAGGLPVHGLVVGGEDPRRRAYAEEVRALVRAHGLDADLSFTGHRGDLREIYAASDLVFSLSTKPESFGRTVLEALSIGTPVIGYDHGGVGEVLGALYPDGRVPPGSADSLETTTRRLLDTPPPVPAEQPFTLDRMLSRTLDLYQRLAAGEPETRPDP